MVIIRTGAEDIKLHMEFAIIRQAAELQYMLFWIYYRLHSVQVPYSVQGWGEWIKLLRSALPVDVLSEGLTPAQHIQHAKFKKFISLNDLRIVLILISVLITETTLYLPLNPAARPLTGTRRDGITVVTTSYYDLGQLPLHISGLLCPLPNTLTSSTFPKSRRGAWATVIGSRYIETTSSLSIVLLRKIIYRLNKA